MMKKGKKHFDVPPLAREVSVHHTVLPIIKIIIIIRYSRLKCPKTPFFPSSVAQSHFDLIMGCIVSERACGLKMSNE